LEVNRFLGRILGMEWWRRIVVTVWLAVLTGMIAVAVAAGTVAWYARTDLSWVYGLHR
jgi:hypothetical protein